MTSTTFQNDVREGIRLAVSMGGPIAVAVVDLLIEAAATAVEEAMTSGARPALTEEQVLQLGPGAALIDAEGDLWVAGPTGWFLVARAYGKHGEPLAAPVPTSSLDLIEDAHDHLFWPFALVRAS